MSKIQVESKAPGKNPFTVICYLCGREYGSKSITIHEQDCMVKWESQNKALPKNMRKPKPVKPSLTDKSSENPLDNIPVGGSGSPNVLQAYNDAAYESFQTQALFPCETCGRKFVPTALEHHKNACKPGMFDRPGAAKMKKILKDDEKTPVATPKPKAQGGGGQELVPCKICSRKFLPSALEHHKNVCKAGGYFEKHPPPTGSGGVTGGKSAQADEQEEKSAAVKPVGKSCLKCKSSLIDKAAKFCSNCGCKL